MSQSIELNDVIRANEWTFNLGFVISNDKLYGQGLRAVDGNVSGFEVAPGNKYLMKEIDFTDMFQPRLGVTFSPNGKDALSASYAKYFPAATSLPRAASWARNLRTTLRAQFDADGNMIFIDPVASSVGQGLPGGHQTAVHRRVHPQLRQTAFQCLDGAHRRPLPPRNELLGGHQQHRPHRLRSA